MKLTVSITRNIETGRLAARVEQSYQLGTGQSGKLAGDDLLRGKRFKNVDSAVCHCDEVLLSLYRLTDPPEIEYVYGKGVV